MSLRPVMCALTQQREREGAGLIPGAAREAGYLNGVAALPITDGSHASQLVAGSLRWRGTARKAGSMALISHTICESPCRGRAKGKRVEVVA